MFCSVSLVLAAEDDELLVETGVAKRLKHKHQKSEQNLVTSELRVIVQKEQCNYR